MYLTAVAKASSFWERQMEWWVLIHTQSCAHTRTMHTTVLSENAWKTSHTISSISGIVVGLSFPCMFGWCLMCARWRLHSVLSRVIRPWTNFFASPLLQQSASCAALASQQCKCKESVSLQDKSWKSCCWPLCNYLSIFCLQTLHLDVTIMWGTYLLCCIVPLSMLPFSEICLWLQESLDRKALQWKQVHNLISNSALPAMFSRFFLKAWEITECP
jgi:hypothetical protein